MMVAIAAIICTHNREDYLGKAIDSLLTQDHDDYEVIVVDNASTDRTREIVEARLPHPWLRYCYEAEVGLSAARNRGMRETEAAIIAYLDDDAIASPGWLTALEAGFEADEELAIAGGNVTLIWPDGCTCAPPWLSDGLAANLGAYDLGPQPRAITQHNLTPRGLNYAIRRPFWEQVGGFDRNLGRVGKNLLSNEELRMTELALKRGWHVTYLPAATVAHHVTPERLERRWFLKRGWWQGVSESYREQLTGAGGWGQFPRGGERIVRGLYKSLKYIADPALRFDNLVYAYGQIGYLITSLRGILFPPSFKS
ncbi:glycosyltransferase family 2 protein [Spirulina major CS-329]|uniref:glycosyltransferase family 2 protein n=1 Tax=Spirulina TaxID=1154 RepID=UPI00232CEAE5|nr:MULTISPECIES: glycosyltransferase family 2 protein [Spirulina]MDB9493249.1 glycosyltransferase family 2 protein [Spirulina subsalsa CS-330]MDB9503325.1 glycosyltransferase family 2 protein [Spirulina major CS-329]